MAVVYPASSELHHVTAMKAQLYYGMAMNGLVSESNHNHVPKFFYPNLIVKIPTLTAEERFHKVGSLKS
jgi:hypothetical protein